MPPPGAIGTLTRMSALGKKLQVSAYFMLGGGFVLSALAHIVNGSGVENLKGLGDAGTSNDKVLRLPHAKLPTKVAQLPAGVKNKPTLKQYDVTDIDTRVGLIGELIRKGSLNADLRERTVEMLASKCDTLGRINPSGGQWCVKEKDCLGEAKALFEYIRNPKSKYAVRYTRDAMLADVFTAPERTLLKTHGGDCFVKGTKVLLRGGHKLVPIETLREGDEVWGYNSWTKVTKVWGDKGILSTWLVRLNNGSSMRLTPDHKVWVADRLPQSQRHGEGEAHVPMSQQVTNLHRVHVRDLQPGDIVLQPDRVEYGAQTLDSDRALIEGLYLSDGWTDENRFCISGKDGHPKEAQKSVVRDACERLGVETSWHERYVRIMDAAWARRLKQMGVRAPDKHALSIDFDQPTADKLLEGIMADAGLNSNGKTHTFTTTSRELWLQTRVLLKQQGISCSERFVADHGGLGRNPIYRLQTRLPWFKRPTDMKSESEKLLAVTEVVRDDLALPCFDIETEDHFVWLPEADWTTSQCDDYVITLGSMLMAVGHPVRLRVIATRVNGVEDAKAPWSHIYLLTPTTFDNPKAKWAAMWVSVDGSMDKPFGWEAPGAAQVAKTGKPAGIVARVRDYTLLKPSDGAGA